MRVRSRSLSLAQSRPSTKILPSVGRSSRPAACSKLDLPEPDGPIRPTTSPGKTSRSTPFSTSNSPSPVTYVRRIPLRLRTGSLIPQRLDRIDAGGLQGGR